MLKGLNLKCNIHGKKRIQGKERRECSEKKDGDKRNLFEETRVLECSNP